MRATIEWIRSLTKASQKKSGNLSSIYIKAANGENWLISLADTKDFDGAKAECIESSNNMNTGPRREIHYTDRGEKSGHQRNWGLRGRQTVMILFSFNIFYLFY